MSRKTKLSGVTYQTKTGCGTLYITVNEDNGKPFEVFATMGKAGGCAASQIETIGRLVSLALRHGVDIKKVIKQMSGISCHNALMIGDNKILSCADAVAHILQEHITKNDKISMEKKNN